MDMRLEKRGFRALDFNESNESSPHKKNMNPKQSNIRPSAAGGSVNRNFIDSMGGIFGMSDEQQQLVNVRASQANNVFPLQKSPSKSPQRQVSIQENSPSKDFRGMETDISTEYFNRGGMGPDDSFQGNQRYNSTMSTQTPFKNKVTNRGAPGNRSSQPQQLSNVKQRQYGNYGQPPKQEEQKYRESTWQERMSQLPKNSAYKSSIAFQEDGMTTKEEQKTKRQSYVEQEQPFRPAKDYGYDIDIEGMNEDDPKAKGQIIKFKQQKLF